MLEEEDERGSGVGGEKEREGKGKGGSEEGRIREGVRNEQRISKRIPLTDRKHIKHT